MIIIRVKEGDKVICIRDFALMFKANEIYEINSVDIELSKTYISTVNGGFWFNLNRRNIYWFNNYFITLSDWRELQIKSVLD